MSKKIQKLYFFMILLFCSSVNALENNDDNIAKLKRELIIQADIIKKESTKARELQEELKKIEQELEESQNLSGGNTSNNSNSSSNTGQRTTGSNNVAPEQYIGSNNRNTQDNASSQINSKLSVNDDKNLDIVKVPNIADSVQKTSQSQTNPSQSDITGNSNQQEIMLGDKKQSNSQINQLDSDGEPLETRENILKFELLQSDIEKAEAKLNDLNNAYMEKKLAFEELEQLQSQLPKQLEIKDNSLNQLQNQEAQKNVAALQGDLQLEKGVVKEELKTQLEETEKNTKNQLTALSAAKDLGYNKLNTDFQSKLNKDKKDHELVQQELVKKEKENEDLQKQITTLGKDKDGLEKGLVDARNKAAALTKEKQEKDNELKGIKDELAKTIAAHALDKQALEDGNKELEKNLADARKNAEDLITANDKALDEKGKLAEVLAAQQDTLAKNQQELLGLNQEREKIAKELKNLTEAQAKKEQEFAAQIAALTKEKQQQDTELQKVQAKLDAEVEDHKAKEQKLKEANDKVAKDLADLTKVQQEKDNELKGIKDELAETIAAHALDKQNLEKENKLVVERFAKAENEIATLMEQKDEVAKVKKQLENSLQVANNEKDAIQAKFDKAEELERLAQVEITKNQQALELAQQALIEKENKFKEESGKSLNLQGNITALKDQMEALAKEKQENEQRIGGLIEEWKVREQEFEVANEKVAKEVAALIAENDQAVKDREEQFANLAKLNDVVLKELAEKEQELKMLQNKSPLSNKTSSVNGSKKTGAKIGRAQQLQQVQQKQTEVQRLRRDVENKLRDLNKKKDDLKREEPQVADRERVLSDKKASLKKEEPQVADRERVLSDKKASLKKEEPQVVDRERVLSDKKASLRKEEPEVAQQARLLDNKKASLRKEEPQVAQQARLLDNKKVSLRKEEPQVAQQERDIEQRKAALKKAGLNVGKVEKDDKTNFKGQAMPATTVHRRSANAKPANQELAALQQKIATLTETNKQLLLNPNSANKAVADNTIKRYSKRSHRRSRNSNNLTKSPNSLEQKVAATNLLEQQNNKAPVVIPKASTTEGASPVKTVRTGASNVLIERGQNDPQLAASKRPTTKVIDPEIVKKDTAVTKPKIVIPAVTRIPNNATPPKILNSLPRQIVMPSRTTNIRD